MLTNTERLDAIESGIVTAAHKMHDFAEFYETRDAINDLMDEVRDMFERLRNIEDMLNTSRQILSMIEV